MMEKKKHIKVHKKQMLLGLKANGGQEWSRHMLKIFPVCPGISKIFRSTFKSTFFEFSNKKLATVFKGWTNLPFPIK
jgi:hypothetical protein